MGIMPADMSADDMAVRLARSARRFGSADSVEDLAELICEVAGELVEVADEVSVSLLERGGGITTVAATNDVCFAVDRFQEEHEEGPCVSAVREAPVTHLEDTSADPEWPAFSAWAAEHGVGSMMAIQLATYEGDEIDPTSGGEGQGALNFYAREPHAFGEDAERTARLLGVHASVALSARQYMSQMGEAVASRDLIGQAKGILMVRLGVDDQAAFGVLRDRSRNTNVRLVEVARAVVEGRPVA